MTGSDHMGYITQLLRVGEQAGTDIKAAVQYCGDWFSADSSDSPIMLMNEALALNAEDWALTGWYFYEQMEKGRIPDAERFHEVCEALGRSVAEPLPASLRWGSCGVELSPVCRDFLLMREPELPPCARLILCEQQPTYHNEALLKELLDFLQRYVQSSEEKPAAILLYGEKESGRRFLLEQVAAQLEGSLLRICPKAAAQEDLEELVLAATLYNAFPLIEEYAPQDHWMLSALSEKARMFFLTAISPVPVDGRLLLQRQVKPMTAQSRVQAMLDLFPQLEMAPAAWHRAAEFYRLQPGRLWQAAARFRAETLGADLPQSQLEDCFHRLLREADTPVFSGGAQLLQTNKRLNDIVLPPEQRKTLDAICAFAKGSRRIYEDWGFGEKIPYGRGVSALFYGASGTGKTLAATALANELELPLYRVDLAQLTSKYIGETQKNISRIFDEAQKSGCILFFDEADALFSRRSEVSDAQDKYANGEIAYLLQKTEQYEGVTILATNLLQNFDEAFRRRITFMVRFPMPDAAQRELLWRTSFPENAPLDSIDYKLLADQFELSGAGIRNCAVYAAFLAMQQDTSIGMHELLQAIQNEYEKLGKTINPQLLQIF